MCKRGWKNTPRSVWLLLTALWGLNRSEVRLFIFPIENWPLNFFPWFPFAFVHKTGTGVHLRHEIRRFRPDRSARNWLENFTQLYRRACKALLKKSIPQLYPCLLSHAHSELDHSLNWLLEILFKTGPRLHVFSRSRPWCWPSFDQ